SLVTLLAAVPAGWAADRFGRPVLMTAGVLLSAVGILGLSAAAGQWGILAGGGLMALGSAAFSSANWAMAADIAPAGAGGKFMGLANIGTAGASAAAGLFGPLVDAANRASPNSGFLVVFGLAALITLSSLLVLRPLRRLMVVQNASRGEAWK
ncbi:MAG TPA: MFS transporter, partial [Anaerolineaceae bacterium]